MIGGNPKYFSNWLVGKAPNHKVIAFLISLGVFILKTHGVLSPSNFSHMHTIYILILPFFPPFLEVKYLFIYNSKKQILFCFIYSIIKE